MTWPQLQRAWCAACTVLLVCLLVDRRRRPPPTAAACAPHAPATAPGPQPTAAPPVDVYGKMDFAELALRTSRAPLPGQPSLVHRTGRLTPQTHDAVRAVVDWHEAACEPPRTPDPDPRVIYALGADPAAQTAATLTARRPHAFLIRSHNASGAAPGPAPRCSGGNYYEVRLESDAAKLHVRVNDLRNGLYLAHFRADEPGIYRGSVILLSESRQHSAHFKTDAKPRERVVAALQLDVRPGAGADARAAAVLPRCNASHVHSGRCVRLEGEACAPQYCAGDPGVLWHARRAVGWVFAPYDCVYRFWPRGQGGGCLDGRWLWFMGDSTMQETYVWFILTVFPALQKDAERMVYEHRSGYKGRSFDGVVCSDGRVHKPNRTNWRAALPSPSPPVQCTRVTMTWNAHYNQFSGKHTGLRTYREPKFRRRIEALVGEGQAPDFIVFNSNLHDQALPGIDQASHAAHMREALDYLLGLPPLAGTRLVWRTCKAPADLKRFLPAGPGQVEALLDAAMAVLDEPPYRGVKVVDFYDAAFPLHWDRTYSDGHHYSKTDTKLGEMLLIQQLLNALCEG